MRFMLVVKATEASERGEMPGEKLLSAMGDFNAELQKAGVLLELSGLKPSSAGARVKFSQGKRTVVDGPFAEAKELIAGFWIIDVRSREEAVEWARRAPMDADGRDAEIEIRPFFELSDFAPSPSIAAMEELGKKLPAPR